MKTKEKENMNPFEVDLHEAEAGNLSCQSDAYFQTFSSDEGLVDFGVSGTVSVLPLGTAVWTQCEMIFSELRRYGLEKFWRLK
jgi:hypothetical protein